MDLNKDMHNSRFISAQILNVLLILTLALFGCEEVINLDLPNRDSNIVVDGLITNESALFTIKLTKTTKYSFKYDPLKVEYEKEALVIITDNTGIIDTLSEIYPGNYRTHISGIKGIIGRSYKIDIFTKEGKHYVSDMEEMLDVPKFDSIYFVRDYNDKLEGSTSSYKYIIYTNMHEPGNTTNYYLRSISYYWSDQWHDNIQWNWVFNDKYINGKYLQKDIISEGYGGKNWRLKLSQYSLTKRAYDFWNLIHEQTQSGDGYANSSVPLIGNVYNADDPNDFALGYLQVSAKTTAEVYINR